MREELSSIGVRELRTPDEVDAFLNEKTGTAMLVVNSVCGCAAGMARPGVRLALQGERRPDHRLLQGRRAGLLHAPPPHRGTRRPPGGPRPDPGLRRVLRRAGGDLRWGPSTRTRASCTASP